MLHYLDIIKHLMLCCGNRAKEERKRRRYMDKNHFQNGMWNVNTVTMGGLGRDPHESSSDDGK